MRSAIHQTADTFRVQITVNTIKLVNRQHASARLRRARLNCRLTYTCSCVIRLSPVSEFERMIIIICAEINAIVVLHIAAQQRFVVQ